MRQLWRIGDKRQKEKRSSTVHRALSRLQEKGLVRKVDREEIDDPPPRQSVWQLTEAGRYEADRLQERYTEEFEQLRKRFGGDWVNDTEAPETSAGWKQVR